MSLVEILSIDSSRRVGEMAADEILAAPHLMQEAMDIALNWEPPMNWRAARGVEIAVEKEPLFLEEIEPQILERIANLPEQGMRGFLKIYKKPKIKLSPAAMDVLLQLCFELLDEQKRSTAVKAYAAQILEKIAKKEPDLIPELNEFLGHIADVDQTVFARAARKIITNLEKVQKKRSLHR